MFGRRVTAAAGVILLTLGLSQQAGAQAIPYTPPELAVFGVEASNGYDLKVLATGSPHNLPGSVAVFAVNGRSAAIYRAPATVTAGRVEADLGEFGRISVKAVRTGRKRAVPASCEGKAKRRIATIRYEGTIEFHGEEDFTAVSARGAPFDYEAYRDFGCTEEGAYDAGRRLPGASLYLHRNPEENELMLQATRRRPGAATSVSVQIDETRGDFVITRATEVRAGADALRCDPRLRKATLAPPAPFAGHATFRRNASAADRWTGNLTVDLPGAADYPLTGPGMEVSLVRPRA